MEAMVVASPIVAGAVRMEKSEGATLELVRWHILRLDGYRHAVWARASAVLSADAIVAAAVAVFISRASGAHRASLVMTLIGLATLLISMYHTLAILGTRGNWHMRTISVDRPALLYSAPDTVSICATREGFGRKIASRTMNDEMEDAVTALWEMELLHSYRIRKVSAAVIWLFLSVLILATATLATVFES
jgi:hypothetical protein